MAAMNRGVIYQQHPREVARAIWEGNAIMGTDGSVTGSLATYSFVISTTQQDVTKSIAGGGYLPPTAQYMDSYSKRPD